MVDRRLAGWYLMRRTNHEGRMGLKINCSCLFFFLFIYLYFNSCIVPAGVYWHWTAGRVARIVDILMNTGQEIVNWKGLELDHRRNEQKKERNKERACLATAVIIVGVVKSAVAWLLGTCDAEPVGHLSTTRHAADHSRYVTLYVCLHRFINHGNGTLKGLDTEQETLDDRHAWHFMAFPRIFGQKYKV